MSYDIVSFGETMIRLSAPDYKRLEQTETMNVNVGGSESSVAIATRRLGLALLLLLDLHQLLGPDGGK